MDWEFTAVRQPYLLQDVLQEVLKPRLLRMVDNLRSALFDDHATVHEDDLVGDLAGEPDLMGDDHHGHAFLGEVEHDVEHFADQFRMSARQTA